MTSTTRSPSTRDAERATDFWGLLLADPDLLRSEFDALVAAEWPDRPSVPPRRSIPGVPAPGGHDGPGPTQSGWTAVSRLPEDGRPRQRSPPRSLPRH